MIDAFNKLDTDEDGDVEIEDLLIVLKGFVSEAEAQEMIHEMEQNASGDKDGKVSRREFMAAMWQKASTNEKT